MAKYLFRVDDVTEKMHNWDNFEKLCGVFKKYSVNPIIAVIPDNEDLKIDGPPKKKWIDIIKDFTIAQHGYKHIKRKKGEFDGLSYGSQYILLEKGKKILEKKFNRTINVYVPPWHEINNATISALEDLKFKYLSNGYGIYPTTTRKGLHIIPVNDWKISRKLFGVRTLTMHVKDITPFKIKKIEKFIRDNFSDIIDISSTGNIRCHTILNLIYIPYFWFRYSHYSPFFRIVQWIKNANFI